MGLKAADMRDLSFLQKLPEERKAKARTLRVDAPRLI
jgi:hypothetical protein